MTEEEQKKECEEQTTAKLCPNCQIAYMRKNAGWFCPNCYHWESEDTPEYRFAQWFASQSEEYRKWFAEEHRKSMETEKKREKEVDK